MTDQIPPVSCRACEDHELRQSPYKRYFCKPTGNAIRHLEKRRLDCPKVI